MAAAGEGSILLRPARRADALHVAALADIAGEGLPLTIWRKLAAHAQSPIEIGRERARREDGNFSYRNATIAELAGEPAGLMLGYPLGDPYEMPALDTLPEIVRPLVMLESEAPGHWYVNILAVYAEFRRHGIARLLLAEADRKGHEAGTKGMAIIVASANETAYALYRAAGYTLAAKYPIAGAPGWSRPGDWHLLTKRLP